MKKQPKIKPAQAKAKQQIQQHKGDLLVALDSTLGIVSPACEKLGLDRTTFYRYYNEDKDFAAAVDSIRDKMLDFCETRLMQRVKEGSDTAIIFALKCLGKKRGYIERQEITGKDGKDLVDNGKLVVEIVSAGCDATKDQPT